LSGSTDGLVLLESFVGAAARAGRPGAARDELAAVSMAPQASGGGSSECRHG